MNQTPTGNPPCSANRPGIGPGDWTGVQFPGHGAREVTTDVAGGPQSFHQTYPSSVLGRLDDRAEQARQPLTTGQQDAFRGDVDDRTPFQSVATGETACAPLESTSPVKSSSANCVCLTNGTTSTVAAENAHGSRLHGPTSTTWSIDETKDSVLAAFQQRFGTGSASAPAYGRRDVWTPASGRRQSGRWWSVEANGRMRDSKWP